MTDPGEAKSHVDAEKDALRAENEQLRAWLFRALEGTMTQQLREELRDALGFGNEQTIRRGE